MSSQESAFGIIVVQLDSYLRRLRSIERLKPKAERRRIPTIKELAKAADVHPTTLSRILNGHARLLNLDIIQIIFTEIWRRGFSIEPNDLLRFEPPVDEVSKSVNYDDHPPPPLTRRQHRKYPGEEFVRAYEEEES